MIPDHDLFRADDGPPPYFRMVEQAAVAGPVPFDPAAAPDVALVRGKLELPLRGEGKTLFVLLAAAGGLESRGIAGDLAITWPDGRSQAQKLLVGEHVWPAWTGATGRGATPVWLGTNAAGDPITASLLAIPLSWPDAPATLGVQGRGNLPFALLGFALSDAEPMPLAAGGDWYDFPIPARQVALPAAPANPPLQGFVRVEAGHLADDGGRLRLWGVNLVGPAALPEDPVEVAGSLGAWGFNLVRLHHIDGEDTLLDPARVPGGPAIDPAALDRFDRFHAALGAAGIRVFAETWTRRAFRPGEGPPDPEGLVTGNKLVGFFEPAWLEAQKSWFAALYDRVNPYTGRHYRDDPTLALLELANENSLLMAWQGGSLEKLPRPHRDRLDARWNAWLRAKYGDDAGLGRAWTGMGRAGLQLGETLQLDSVAREPSQRSRTELYPTRRSADLVEFYGELEAAYFAELARFVRGLGFRLPLVCTASLGLPLADRQLAACDVIDLHLYWDPAGEANVFTDASVVKAPGRWIERLGACQADKPCTLSELNHTWPNRHGQEAPLFWAGLAARQELDAVTWFAWSHAAWRPEPDGPGGSLDLEGRFSTMAQLPVAAALFREGLPAGRPWTRWWSPDGLLRDLAEPSSLWLDELVHPVSWLERRIRTSFAPRPPVDPPGGEPSPLRWTEAGFSGATARTRWVIGRGEVPGLAVEASGWPAVSLRALDGQDIEASRELLLVVAGRTERAGTLWSAQGPNPLVLGKGPARLELLRGRVRLALSGRLRAELLDPRGVPTFVQPLRRRAGAWELDLGELRGPWLRLRR